VPSGPPVIGSPTLSLVQRQRHANRRPPRMRPAGARAPLPPCHVARHPAPLFLLERAHGLDHPLTPFSPASARSHCVCHPMKFTIDLLHPLVFAPSERLNRPLFPPRQHFVRERCQGHRLPTGRCRSLTPTVRTTPPCPFLELEPRLTSLSFVLSCRAATLRR
jgi:hypothetical protein